MTRRRRATVRHDAGTIAELGCACASARQLARMLTRVYDQQLRGAGLEAAQFALLSTLDSDGPCTQSTLGRHHGLDKTTVSRNLNVLKRKGWVARLPTLDRRERRIGLTATGRAMLEDARPHWQKAQRSVQQAMTPKQWRALFAALRTAAKAADSLRVGST
jgi:DNA-binding MarR family transcriptional regulator